MEAIAKQSDSVKITVSNAVVCCMACFSTMPIISLHLGGKYISLFTIFFALSILLFVGTTLFNNVRIKIKKQIAIFISWLLYCIFSSLFGFFYFTNYPTWQDAATSSIPKILAFVTFALFIATQPNKGEIITYIVKGLIFGCICNLIWTILDGSCFYLFGFSLTNSLFHNYAVANNIRYETLSIITGGMIRSSGFNYDPAHMGFIIPAMVIYALKKKKLWLFLLCLFAMLFSASTTAVVCSIIVIIINVDWRSLPKKKIKNSPAKTVCAIFLFCLIVVLTFTVFGPIISKFYNRVKDNYLSPNSDNPRLIYIKYLLSAISFAGPLFLFGTGFNTASYAYVFNKDILALLGSENFLPYDIEMTYISYFFDLGIVGGALFIYFLYKIFKTTRANNSPEGIGIYSLICGMIFASLFYHYTLMAMQIIVLIIGLMLVDQKASNGSKSEKKS